MRIYSFFFIIFYSSAWLLSARCQTAVFEKPRISVAQGLPQSYISGLVQDSHGFVWIATLDGLARFDGRSFKIFRHKPGDTATLSANNIRNVFFDHSQQLWLQYEGGGIDILNTETEQLFHLTKTPVFSSLFSKIKTHGGIIEDAEQNYWLLGDKGGVFIINLKKGLLHFYSDHELGFDHNRITGIAADNNRVLLVTDTAFVIMRGIKKVEEIIPYSFDSAHLFNPHRSWKDNSPVIRKDSSVIVFDENRLIIFNPATNSFSVKALPAMRLYVSPCHITDYTGNIIFSFFGTLYKLTPLDDLSIWRDSSVREAISSMLFDFSGVLWAGTTGYGLRQFDTRLPRMPALSYNESFPKDILRVYLHVNVRDIEASPLKNIKPYLFRWAEKDDGKIWMSQAGADRIQQPNLCYYDNGKLITPVWHYTDTVADRHKRINALAFSSSGKMWGIDYDYRLLQIDTSTHTVKVCRQVQASDLFKIHEISSMLIDGEDIFWISSSTGLVRYDLKTKKSTYFTESIFGYTTGLANDPADKNILWAGSNGNGLIRLNKNNFQYKLYTTDDGLPNNTVYAILPARGKFWCSSNKGIFLFDPLSHAVNSYTTMDGLPADEFNRMHYFKSPDGSLAFGGTSGYVVFNPATMAIDDFNPAVVITDLKINNTGADYGVPGSPLTQPVNELKKLILPYWKNFLSFDFAAIEYNIPEKLHYRYMMQGLDKQWIEIGINNTAAYTSLPPGSYVLKVNSTNTTGKWSKNIKTIIIIIEPPFWHTWWFMIVWILSAILFLYFFIRRRVIRIRKEEQQKNRFDNEVTMLEAQALRAQMNPHFIFNCLNSIKALIQEDRKQQAVVYLTTFSKLIRGQLSNSQQEITLYEELQTCTLYTQMESMRFGDKIDCHFIIADTADTQSVNVPPLFLQPIIENAIWHGILPMGAKGMVTVGVERKQGTLYCVIDDNGIGRRQAAETKSKINQTHQSKGMELVENRLRLYNMKKDRHASVEVVDKYDEQGKATGTQVIFKFKVND